MEQLGLNTRPNDDVAVAGLALVDGEQDTDAAIILASAEDPQKFATIFSRHYSSVYRYAARSLGSEDGADVAGEVFVRAFAARERFDPSYSDARPWLLGIAAHIVAGRYRRWARESRANARFRGRIHKSTEFEEAAVERLDAQGRRAALALALEKLRPQEREVVGLYAFAEMSQREIAAALGIPEGTVKSRLNRARARLRNSLLWKG